MKAKTLSLLTIWHPYRFTRNCNEGDALTAKEELMVQVPAQALKQQVVIKR